MGMLTVIRAIIASGDKLKEGGRWQASHKIDGKQTKERPKVERFDCGLNRDEGFWFHFDFTEPDGSHSLHGTFALDNRNEEILYDKEAVEEDDVIVSERFRGFQLRGVIEFEFVKGQDTHRYRFDATVMRVI